MSIPAYIYAFAALVIAAVLIVSFFSHKADNEAEGHHGENHE